jgi:8-amino-7-oxononanoate synthase
MRRLLAELAARLEELEATGLRRRLEEPDGVDFSSNDYLGLSRHPQFRERLLEALARGPLSAPASRLLRGNTAAHRDLEERLARWKGTEAALLFPSGYQANIALLTSILGPRDLAVSDASNHASIIDGLRLSRCDKAIYPHLDAAAAEEALAAPPRRGRAVLVTESLFSMDGDIAPLGRLADIADASGAVLIIDDAHATGVFGRERGSGLAEDCAIEHRAAAIVSTFGKAIGFAGAFVAGPRIVIEHLVNAARPFIFTTATPPAMLAAAGVLLDLAAAEPWRRARVLALADRLRAALAAGGVRAAGGGPIVPVVLGGNERALRVAEGIRRHGHDVRAIRPPSVPAGTARIRISVHADHAEEEIDGLARAVIEAVGAEG